MKGPGLSKSAIPPIPRVTWNEVLDERRFWLRSMGARTMKSCSTCKHWSPVAQCSDDGECSRIGVSVYTESKHVVLAGNLLPGGPDAPTLITDAHFGCILWEAAPL